MVCRVLSAFGWLLRGYYMMFVLNSARIPSAARWIKVI